MEATKFVPLKPDILAKILDHRISEYETNQWAGEAHEVLESKNKTKTRYLMLTEVCIYILDRSFKERRMHSYLDLANVSTNNEMLNLEFRQSKLQFILPDSSAVAGNIFAQLSKLSYGISGGQFSLASPIGNDETFKKYPKPTKRPPNLSLMRYISACISKDTTPQKYAVDLLTRFDDRPHSVVTLANADMQVTIPLMVTLTFESFVRNITLDNFGINVLSQTLNWVLSFQNKFSSLDLVNYDNVTLKGLIFRRSAFNNVSTIRIRNCTSAFIVTFLESIKHLNYGIETILFDSIHFDQEASEKLIQSLQSTTFLSNLNALGFMNCQTQTGSFCDFAAKCIKATEHLESFSAINCDIDVCDMLLEITKSEINIQSITLRKNSGKTIIGHDESIIGNSVLTIDVGECEWTDDSFISFLSAICRKIRRSPLSLTLDHTNVNGQWGEIFERLPIESFMPILTELNLSNNMFDDRAFSMFMNFLETQSPLLSSSKTKLMHLNISHCFKENVQENLKKLISFFSKRELWGLEICGCPPIPELIQVPGLHALNISDNDFDKVAIDNLIKFVSDSTTLSELGINNIKFQDVKAMMQFYTGILTHSKILAFSPLTTLFTEYSNYAETAKIKEFLNNKSTFSTTTQRIKLFLGLTGDFSTRVPQEIIWNEENEQFHNSTRQSVLLSDATFSNPVQSLFTLATKSTADTSFDPVASLVSEYVETSGRFGIIPPTAPPFTQPSSQFMLPSIFSTMITKNELEDEDKSLDIDPLNQENQQLSEKMAELFKSKCPSLKITGTPELWSNPNSTVAFPAIPLQST